MRLGISILRFRLLISGMCFLTTTGIQALLQRFGPRVCGIYVDSRIGGLGLTECLLGIQTGL